MQQSIVMRNTFFWIYKRTLSGVCLQLSLLAMHGAMESAPLLTARFSPVLTCSVPCLQRLTLAFRSAAQAATQVLRSWHLLPTGSHSAHPATHSVPTTALQQQQPSTDAQSPAGSPQAPAEKAAAAVSATWSALQQKAADSGFIKMLHSLDKPTITLEAKWPELQRHLAGHAELG